MANNTPAATAEPMTPATFGPMACINKKLLEFASNPTLLETLAAMGTAETPAEPISGLMGVDESLFMIFAKMIPDAVPIQNATKPNNKIPMVSTVKKIFGGQFGTDSQTQQNGHNVDEFILSRIGKSIDNFDSRRSCQSKVHRPDLSSGNNKIHRVKTNKGNTFFNLRTDEVASSESFRPLL